MALIFGSMFADTQFKAFSTSYVAASTAVASSIHSIVHHIRCSRAPSPVTVTSLLLTSLTSTRRVRHYFSPSFLPNTPLLAASLWARHHDAHAPHQRAAKDSPQREDGQRCRLRVPAARTAHPQAALHAHKGSCQLDDINSIRSHVRVSIHVHCNDTLSLRPSYKYTSRSNHETKFHISPPPTVFHTAPLLSPTTSPTSPAPSNCSHTHCVPVYRHTVPSLCLLYR
jgi:hypothetical protein